MNFGYRDCSQFGFSTFQGMNREKDLEENAELVIVA
jgi:hypothetical protein